MKHLRLIPDNTKIPFMRFRRVTFALSALIIAATLVGWMAKGFTFGIDFTGGTVIEARQLAGTLDVSHLREKVEKLGLGEVNVREFGGGSDVQIRLAEQPGGEEAQQAAVEKVKATLKDEFELRNVEVVGPAVSADLRRDAFIAVIMSMVLILIYLWFRFEWQYAVAAVLTTLHDVIFTLGVMIFFHIPFDLPILAAILTIVGYSLNDTIVIYDRIREVLRKYKKMPIADVIDLSINQTLGRTVVTSITVFIAAMALLVFGGEALRGFNLIMVLGVLIGTYSSIVISAPLLILLNLRARNDAKDKPAAATPAKA